MILAYIVSSHGFGHAARSAAIIEALHDAEPDLRVEILTTTPRWFFSQSLECPFGWHEVVTDLGLVQASSLEEDIGSTVERLGGYLSDPDRLVTPIAEKLRQIEPDLVICDISPWGLEAARRLALPRVLVENFTWDWIYRGYGEPALDALAEGLANFFTADHHFRLEPFCGDLGQASPLLPVARRPRQERGEVRRALGVPTEAPMAMVTMGGVPWRFEDIEGQLAGRPGDRHLVIAGGAPEVRHFDRCVLIPHRSDFHHPDLVAASDLVVGKLGYSTVAEVAENGAAFLYVPRPRFPESPPLEEWVRENLSARRFPPQDLTAADWLSRLDEALDELDQQAKKPARGGGAAQAATEILQLLR